MPTELSPLPFQVEGPINFDIDFKRGELIKVQIKKGS